MPKFTCVFVKEDKKTIHSDVYADADEKLIQADTAREAAATYKLEASKWRDSLVGPIVRTCDENGDNLFFEVDDYTRTPEEIEATKKELAEAKQAAQSSLSTTDVLLKELLKEQKSTNGRLRLGLAIGMALISVFLYKILRKLDSL